MRALIVLLLLFCTATAAATPPDWVLRIGYESPPAILLGDDRIEFVQAGDKAPYDGMLLDLDTATRWTLRADWQQKQLRLDTDTLRAVMTHELEAKDSYLAIAEASYKREISGLRVDLREQAKAYAKSLDRPFYRTAVFGLAMGLLLSGICTVAIASAVR